MREKLQRARSIQPKFPEISVQNSMDRFGPTGKVSKKPVFSRSDRLEFWLNGSRPKCIESDATNFIILLALLLANRKKGTLSIG